MNIKQLSDFLKIAKKNTYASGKAQKVASTRPKSKDYEHTEGNIVYHDTYFGANYFIGEEIAYENGEPVWGMNYNGYVLDDNITEAEIDKTLRVALQGESGDLIPVRGPERFAVEDYEYTNTVTGTLERFEGREEIKKAGRLIYYAIYHGGLIK